MTNMYTRQNVGGFILKALQNLGGTASKKEIKSECVNDDAINLSYEDVYLPVRSKKSGRTYVPFNFDFNFGLKELMVCGYILPYSRKSDIVLTQKGRTVEWSNYPTQKDQFLTNAYKETDEKSKTATHIDEFELCSDEETDDEKGDWEEIILEKIKQVSPKKFESFSRLLFSKMGVKFDEKEGVQMSGDHGIDGYGFFESSDFRTTRVAIQCKRFSDNNPVSEPDVDKFKGAMSKFNAEYGIFITTSSFTKKAKESATRGSNTVTLIDGERLIELIKNMSFKFRPLIN